MTPTECEPTVNPGAIQRNVWCRAYSKCLDLVIAQGWPSFSCLECDAYEQDLPVDPVERREDAGKCARLWAGSIRAREGP